MSSQHYRVLARKYRPQTFSDMIGQEAVITTLTNAFKVGRIAHAFMLTGVRGIGKTTTARLLARALNYESDSYDQPTTDLNTIGRHCTAIMASNHMDVLELDAASRTGVDNMRELLEGVRYGPVEARYKIYIIDEVHMLSTGAFNALLKTLEEPPDHAKFIFATTEIRKIPVTVLSRCQRFDLRRVDIPILQTHLKRICEHENVRITPDGLTLIARAAEGSVRDSLSLLDQAIVQTMHQDQVEINADQIRDMLGLADRASVIDLFEKAALGDGAAALTHIQAQYKGGADPVLLMRDLLDICHDVSRARTLQAKAEFDWAKEQISQLKALAEQLSPGQLTRIWQILLKAHQDVRQAPVPLAAAEMALLSLAIAADLPPPEWIARIATEIPTTSPAGTPAAALTPDTVPPRTQSAAATQTEPQTLDDTDPNTLHSLEAFMDALPKTHIRLHSDIKRYVRPIHFQPGKFSFQPVENAPVTLSNEIAKTLKQLTGKTWMISTQNEGGCETLKEKEQRELEERDVRERSHPVFFHPLLARARLIEIVDKPENQAHNIIVAEFPKNR